MPSISSRSVNLSANYVRASGGPVGAPSNNVQAITAPSTGIQSIPLPTPPPGHLVRSTLMLSSLPSIGQSGDGVVRQFYFGRHLPTRRIALL